MRSGSGSSRVGERRIPLDDDLLARPIIDARGTGRCVVPRYIASDVEREVICGLRGPRLQGLHAVSACRQRGDRPRAKPTLDMPVGKAQVEKGHGLRPDTSVFWPSGYAHECAFAHNLGSSRFHSTERYILHASYRPPIRASLALLLGMRSGSDTFSVALRQSSGAIRFEGLAAENSGGAQPRRDPRALSGPRPRGESPPR
jgi:hypothetical protein